RLDLQTLFNSIVFATDAQGIRTAVFPNVPNELNIDFRDRDYIAKALDEKQASIGRPVIGRTTKQPSLVMGAPVVDFRGNVIGALAASTTLAESSYLDQVAASQYGKTGGYLLISRAHRLVIAATDKNLVLEPLRPTGEIPVMDQYVNGYVGSAIYTRPSGDEVLSSAAAIPVADWILVAILPTQEAFAPIRQMQQFMRLATIFLTLLAGGAAWWMLRRQLLPLLTVVKSLSAQAKGEQLPKPLAYEREDEIGELIDGFNHVLKTLGEREAALIDSEF
ncbi:diguanylate phosphodiesterase, partial [bacterium]|nr:diguanylate phosphodiesterase [bacterium]